jgi:lipopolysaccharide transport system ATP-binding protein
MQTVIKVEDISKRYRIGAKRQNSTLRDMIADTVKAPFRWRNGEAKEDSTIWALKNVSFEVKQGETVGIIGHNGAGKSTLLKILSRITKPTSGEAELKGRVGSLLEIGTGFHQELTGRENIFLNGAILGMKREEIQKKFDEIVAFSEIEKFLDTPVKHYSSGMYMRLAFSVAAHLESEILLMDEVLAVGDVNFQLKCLDKMQQIRQQGRTILFVSHNMSAISRICQRSIALQKGRIVSEGPTPDVVRDYFKFGYGIIAERSWNDDDGPGNEVVKLKTVRVCDKDGRTIDVIDIRNPFGISAIYEVLQDGHILIPNYHFFNEERLHLFAVQDVASKWRRSERKPGIYTSTAWIPGNFLAEGNFVVEIAISSHLPRTRVHLQAPEAVGFEIVDSFTGDTARGDYQGRMPGLIRPMADWTTEYTPTKD